MARCKNCGVIDPDYKHLSCPNCPHGWWRDKSANMDNGVPSAPIGGGNGGDRGTRHQELKSEGGAEVKSEGGAEVKLEDSETPRQLG